MSLADWDDVLVWLRDNGAPAWCIKRREQELRQAAKEVAANPVTLQGYVERGQNADAHGPKGDV